jgi:carbon-monoxide dehydrogenase medium subunit
MALPEFDIFIPKSLDEAFSLLSQYNKEACIIAGGTDLLPKMKRRRIDPIPRFLINIKEIPELKDFRYDDKEGLSIGALTTMQLIKESRIIKKRFSILTEAAGLVGTTQVRNLGTIGGNLCNASPATETAPALITLGAKVKIVNKNGERTVDLENFFTGPGKSVLQRDEILTEIIVPNLPSNSGGTYLKYSTRRLDVAIVGVGVVITLSEGDKVSDIRVAFASVAPTPIRMRKAEEVIRGQKITLSLLERASEIAAEESNPIDDLRGQGTHRREMIKVLTKQAFERAYEQAKGKRWLK